MLKRILAALSLALVACAPVEAPANEPATEGPVEISLQRTICFGTCPAYMVRITGDGEVIYTGERFVNVTGEQRARIPREDVQRLLERFDAVGFDNLRDAYRGQMTDLPTTTIRLTRNGSTKVVLDYGGVSAGMPATVRDLQAEIDRVAGTARWVLRNGERVRDTPQP